MLLNPERITGWAPSVYLIMILVVTVAFAVGYIRKRRKYVNLCIVLISTSLVIMCEIALTFQLGGTNLFFLEWLAYFGELLVFLPFFVGCLLGIMTKLIIAKRKLSAA